MAKKSSSVVTVDFEGVESGGKRVRKAGEYLCKVEEITKEIGDIAPYLAWQFEVIDGECEGSKLWTNTSLAKQALFNLRGLLEALGEEVPDSELDIDLEDMVDKEVVLVVEMEDYEGKSKARVVDYYPADDYDSKGKKSSKKDDDEEDDKKSKKKSSKKKEQIDADEVGGMDEDELADLIKKHDLDVDLDEYASIKKKRAAVVSELEEKDMIAE